MEWDESSREFVPMPRVDAERVAADLQQSVRAIAQVLDRPGPVGLESVRNFRLCTVSSCDRDDKLVPENERRAMLEELRDYYAHINGVCFCCTEFNIAVQAFTVSQPAEDFVLKGTVAKPFDLAWCLDKTLFVNMEQEKNMWATPVTGSRWNWHAMDFHPFHPDLRTTAFFA